MGLCRFGDLAVQVDGRVHGGFGITLVKFWLEVSNQEQERMFLARIKDPFRQWKLSPVDLPSRECWCDYSRARDRMLKAPETDYAPCYLVHSDDKKRARLNLIAHLLSLIPYKRYPGKRLTSPSPLTKVHMMIKPR